MHEAAAMTFSGARSVFRPELALVPARSRAGTSAHGETRLERHVARGGSPGMARSEALAEIWARARQTWPKIALGRERFTLYCEAVLGDTPSSAWAAQGSELYLCCACAAGDGAAQRVLSLHYLKRVEEQLSASCHDPELVDETMQALGIKLLVGPEPKIARFSGRGPLLHWLRVAAKRALLDLVRARRSQRQVDKEVPVECRWYEQDPLVGIRAARYARTFMDILQHAIDSLSSQDRLLMKHAAVDGGSIDVIGNIYSVHRSTVARRLQRIRQGVATAVRRRLKAEHRLSDGDVDELTRELCASLQPSLHVLLGGAEPAP
jgi:RNA polymerase sigma-70 factor, ECF subfamily